MVGVSGRSGCGKTSLLRAILGFVPLATGEVEVCGLPLTPRHVDEIRRHVAYVPQELQAPVASVGELVALTHGLQVNASDRALLRQRTECFFGLLGISSLTADFPSAKLSGGQRHRVLLAAALATRRPVLLLDEPTSALDAASTGLVADLLHRVCSEEGRAAVVVSHSPRLLQTCETIIPLTSL